MAKHNEVGRLVVRNCGCLGMIEKITGTTAKFWNLVLCHDHGGQPSWSEDRPFAGTVTHIHDYKKFAGIRDASEHEIMMFVRQIARTQAVKECHERLVDALKEAMEVSS